MKGDFAREIMKKSWQRNLAVSVIKINKKNTINISVNIFYTTLTS